MTSSARISSSFGTGIPRVRAVLRLDRQLELSGLLDRKVGGFRGARMERAGHLRHVCDRERAAVLRTLIPSHHWFGPAADVQTPAINSAHSA